MQIVTSWMREGIEQGIQQGQASTVLRQLRRKFGELNLETKQQIQNLSSLKLDELAETLLDFQQIEDLTTWLANNNLEEQK